MLYRKHTDHSIAIFEQADALAKLTKSPLLAIEILNGVTLYYLFGRRVWRTK